MFIMDFFEVVFKKEKWVCLLFFKFNMMQLLNAFIFSAMCSNEL